ncbi:MAG: MFS transporter [Planctomycetes bacterium]|nr:MFS transporter [Planctomycetota bacterium]
MPIDESNLTLTPPAPSPMPLSTGGRYLILVTAFLGWLFAGMLLQITSLAMRSAAIDLLSQVGGIDLEHFNTLNKALQSAKKGQTADSVLSESDANQLKVWRASVQEWFAYYQCAFLFGAAAGGFVFGRLGDRFGRSKAVAGSIVCYSLLAGTAFLVRTPIQLLVLWFLACLGIGGMWPNGIALVSETWSNMSRPMVAGIIGTAANVGIFVMATLGTVYKITPDHWRWVLLVGAAPVVLGLFVWLAVPESPRWLAAQAQGTVAGQPAAPASEVFQPPFLSITLVGILLATIPLIGGWGSANWMMPWAGEAGETASPPNPYLQAHVGQARAFTGMVGSLLGGWIASVVGRRRTYFVVSLAALCCAQYAFWFLVPTDGSFLFWVAALGFFSGIYFGWLPLFLPELFPTRVRSTGAGVSFNFGRILTAVTVFATGALTKYFAGDYARIGRVTSLIFVIGLVAIWLAPDTSGRQLEH